MCLMDQAHGNVGHNLGRTGIDKLSVGLIEMNR